MKPQGDPTITAIANTIKFITGVSGVVKVICSAIEAQTQSDSGRISTVNARQNILEGWNAKKLTGHQSARLLAESGCNDQQITAYLRQTDRVHLPSGREYKSPKMRFASERQQPWPLMPGTPVLYKANWRWSEDDWKTWVDLPESESRPGSPPRPRGRGRGRPGDDEPNAMGFFGKRRGEPNSDNFSLEKKEELLKDEQILKNENASNLETNSSVAANNLELESSNHASENIPVSSNTYQLVSSYGYTRPATFTESIVGRSILIFGVILGIVLILKKWVLKPQDDLSITKQPNLVSKENKFSSISFKEMSFIEMLPFVQSYYLRRDITLAFTLAAYQNNTFTLEQASYILAQNCGLTQESIQVLLPLHQEKVNS